MENKSITRQRILQELGDIAFARATDMITVRDGQLEVADTAGLTGAQACAIASVEKSAGGIKVKFYDKMKALELLGKAVGLFEGQAQQHEDNGLLGAILAATAEALD